MTTISVLGMDPSLNNWGLAFGQYFTDTNQIQINSIDVIQPASLEGKQTRTNSSDIYRASQLSQQARKACDGATAVFIEVPHGSQSSRAMASYGICIGILGSLKAQNQEFFEVTANELKLATTGQKGASKQAIIDRAIQNYPHINWPYQTQKGQTKVVTGKAEHMADAIGAIEAGILTPAFRQMLQFIAA